MKKLVSILLVSILILGLSACGKKNEAQSVENNLPVTKVDKENATDKEGPYSSYDLTNPVTIEMYVLGDVPTDLDKVVAKVNSDYLQPNLNSTLKVNFLSWADYSVKYPLMLAGSDAVDLIFTSSWCYYSEEAAKGAFKELTMDWIKEWMPQTYISQVPASWEQISLDGKIFAVPRNAAGFEFKDLLMIREDLREKHNLPAINSWDTFKQYLYTVAEKENIEAYAAAGNAEPMFYLWRAEKMTGNVANGYDFHYIHNNSDAAPKTEEFYYYPTSDMYKEFVLEMADFAKNKVWSKNAINNSIAVQDSFVQGKSASLIWNPNMFKYGKELEDSGVGTYAVYDVTPSAKFKLSPYSGDAMAITAHSKNPERAALVLDYIKNDPDLNLLIIGGIEGEHYTIQDDGLRAAGPAAANYNFDHYGWAFRTENMPKSADTDPRQLTLEAALQNNIFSTPIDGFSFNPVPVQTELALLNSIFQEYNNSFQLGLFGEKTESVFEEYKGKLNKTGAIEIVQAELIKQYLEFCSKKGINL